MSDKLEIKDHKFSAKKIKRMQSDLLYFYDKFVKDRYCNLGDRYTDSFLSALGHGFKTCVFDDYPSHLMYAIVSAWKLLSTYDKDPYKCAVEKHVLYFTGNNSRERENILSFFNWFNLVCDIDLGVSVVVHKLDSSLRELRIDIGSSSLTVLLGHELHHDQPLHDKYDEMVVVDLARSPEFKTVDDFRVLFHACPEDRALILVSHETSDHMALLLTARTGFDHIIKF